MNTPSPRVTASIGVGLIAVALLAGAVVLALESEAEARPASDQVRSLQS